MQYCNDIFTYKRRKTREVMVGDVGVGGSNPIRVQSMTIADTMDTQATVAEVIELVEAGCEIVRITAPSIHEAENLGNIKAELTRRGINVPLVADIHFTPNAALSAADHVEKVRINPGNYADRKKFEHKEYTDDEYGAELLRIEKKFKPLVLKCKELGRAMRIGTNHGSLSDRIMNRYGDTAEGMVESALEFVRICQKYDYHELILSMKSSNPLVAIQAYRLLAARMDELGMDYPFHIGVTEAGDAEEGRIKSAVGIGGLLEDGIGDTIRVSLTEDAVAEIPVAFSLVEKYNRLAKEPTSFPSVAREVVSGLKLPNPFEHSRRQTLTLNQVYHKLGHGELPRVELSLTASLADSQAVLAQLSEMLGLAATPLKILSNANGKQENKCETAHVTLDSAADLRNFREIRRAAHRNGLLVPFAVDCSAILARVFDVAEAADRLVVTRPRDCTSELLSDVVRAARLFGRPIEWAADAATDASSGFVGIAESLQCILSACEKADYWNILFSVKGTADRFTVVRDYRYLAGKLDALGANFPIVIRYKSTSAFETCLLEAASQIGSLLCDGIGDAIHVDAELPVARLLHLSYDILQATRVRISKTDYISCPSCGRTLFNLQTTTERIKSKTSHLKGVKIAIMGCIVNGPGEMADADFGYVGAGPGKVNLFVGKECVERNIPEGEADARLIELIQSRGVWVEP